MKPVNMLSTQQLPAKEIDVAFLVFIERYATDLLKWDILTFFANNPELCVSAATVAERIGRTVHSVQPALGDLVLSDVLNQCELDDGQSLYQLTKTADLRRMVLKFAVGAG